MDEYYENWRMLAASILIEVIDDYRHTTDPYYKEALVRWINTDYGSGICELAGVSSDLIVKEVFINEKGAKINI